MGQEVVCRAKVGRQVLEGKALLESDHVLFRGDTRVKVPFKSIEDMKVANGWLTIAHSDGKLALELGSRADKWAQRILNPPSVADKLGIKDGQKVAVLGKIDDGLAAEIAGTGATVSSRMSRGVDHALLVADESGRLERVKSLVDSIARDGGIWVVYPKGRKDITENDVLEAGRAAGLTDIKVASVSPTHTGLRFVIPKAHR